MCNLLNLSIGLSLLITSSIAVDLEGAKERVCDDIPKTATIDTNFLASSDVWYYPLMSRLDLYLTALELYSDDPSDLQENDLYYQSCLRFQQRTEKDPFLVTGFGGEKAGYLFAPYNSTEYDENRQNCYFMTPSGNGGTTFFTLTDNSTFCFTVTCWDDNQMSWGVTSPHKTLPQETIKVIHDHATEIGFDKKFFTGIQYNNCK